MIWPCQETLRQIATHLPDALLAPQALASLEVAASQLPDAMSSYYLEFRLAPNSSQVDFSTCISTAHGGCSALQHLREPLPPPAHESAYSRAQSFLRLWSTPGSALHSQIPLVWLEFDKASEASFAVPSPSINFCLDPVFLMRPVASLEGSHPNTRSYQSFLEVALELLLGQRIPERVRRTLLICFASLPPGGHIDHMAVMLGRSPPVLKINTFIPQEELAGFLRRIDWPGEWDALNRVLKAYVTTSEPARLDLTIDGTITPRIGIEFFTGDVTASHSEKRRLLDQLVEHGYCCPMKREAVLRWPGEDHTIFTAQSWLTRIRRFSHLKLVCHAGYLAEAKAYLGFAPSLYSPFERGNHTR